MYNATELPTIHNLQAGRFESNICKAKISTRTFARAEHMPIPQKHIAKMIISQHAIKVFIKCLQQTGFLFHMNNYTNFLIFLKFKN